ncbi:hypothetical protein GH714_013475 [Hevea brasiliensis]|uniref:Uncharacterized protein n=1 Tax=Hevea brasiliensis TaxID=3981 RepID=A0A6A6N2P8_HEVBR|nr:hypothetical protein GH714_013475 [Hevea brasiliensis]
MAESLHIDVQQDDDSGSEKADRFAQKVSSLERIFLIANFILELPSAAFDQLSSVHKPQYHADNPIKVSVWPVFFAFGLLYSSLSTQKRPTPYLRRLNRAEEFSMKEQRNFLSQLAAATNDFSLQNKIGVGRSYVVYKGKLPDVPKILANELVKVLDDRIGPPELVKEAEAVELVAYTALHCVNLEGNNRTSMTNIVANLDQASSLCDVRNEGLPIGAEQLHGRSNKEVATPMEQRSINPKIHQKGNNNSAFECTDWFSFKGFRLL